MKRVKNTHIHIFALIFIALLCCLQIRALDYIVVLNDEFGYWGHAVCGIRLEGTDIGNSILLMGIQHLADSHHCHFTHPGAMV